MEPPWSKKCPVVQRIIEKGASPGWNDALNSVVSDSGLYFSYELVNFDGQSSKYFKFSDLLFNYFNLNHPVILWIMDIIMSAQTVKSQIGARSYGQIIDAVTAFFNASDRESTEKELISLSQISRFYGILPKEELPQKYELDFVPVVERVNPFEEEIDLTRRFGMLYQV